MPFAYFGDGELNFGNGVRHDLVLPTRADAEAEIHNRATRRVPEGARGSSEDREALPTPRDQRSHVSLLEAEVRRDAGDGRPLAQDRQLKRIVADQPLDLQVVKDPLGK